MELRVRNKEIRKVRVADLEDAPWNFRTHPDGQQAALDGAIGELGFYGYPDVYETEDGTLRICDGHLRKSRLIAVYGAGTEIEVNVTDFDEAEARKATLTHDPLAAMAGVDSVKLDELLRDVQTGDEALSQMLADLADSNGLYQDGQSDGETKLKELNVMPPPAMTWVLLGIPTVRFGEINQAVETLAAVPGIFCESTSNDG